jgi:acetate kinase
MKTKKILAQGGVDKVGLKGSSLKLTLENGDKVILDGEILEYQSAIEYILGVLTSEKYGCIKSLNEIDAVGHRVVHGGEKFNESMLITDDVLHKIEECIEIAPLHNPPNLKGINAISELIPNVPQVAVFDTAFHQTMPEYAYMYGIPYSLYKKYGIRKYGFHGTSHRYVARRACELLNVPYESQRIITCHIGNGGSIAAIRNGKSVDTTMGFTPVEGLLMGTRSGDIDAGVLPFLMDKEMIGASGISTLLNKHSGILGISGVSSDMRELLAAIENGNTQAILALNMYNYRIKKYIGAYAAALGGVDILIFTGGVGENNALIRFEVCSNLEFMGIAVNEDINKATRAEEKTISLENSHTKIMVIPTDEELMIASDTMALLEISLE